MASNLIPAVGTKGKYTLLPPFDAAMALNTLYTLSATRQFDEIETFGENIYEQFYQPFMIEESKVATDRAAGAVIVTLMTANSKPLYIPSTYIKSYPDLSYHPYNQYIMVMSFGALPDDTLFDPTIQALKNTASEFLGVEPEINIASMPLNDVVTPEQSANLEAARQAAITNRSTDYAKVVELQGTNALLQQRITILEKIVKDKGLLN